jgi:hypothetical protein
MCDLRKTGSRKLVGHRVGRQIVESAGPGLALEPSAVPQHAPRPLQVPQRVLGAERGAQGEARDPPPRRVRHVHREHEPTARPEHAEHFRQHPVVGGGRPGAGCRVERFGVGNRQPGHGVVERAVGEYLQPLAEVVTNESDAVARRRCQIFPQSGVGVLVGRGTIGTDDRADRAAGPLPDGAGERPAAAPQIEPPLARTGIGPLDRVGEQFAIGRQVVLCPERLRAPRVGPVIRCND